MYEKRHLERAKKRPRTFTPVSIERTREKSVERLIENLIDLICKNEIKAIAVAVVRKDGYIQTHIASNGQRFPLVGALEQLKLDLLDVNTEGE